jgi:hypothetical protein
MYEIKTKRETRRSGLAPSTLPVLIEFSTCRKDAEPVDRLWALLGLLNDEVRQELQKSGVIDYDEGVRLKYHDMHLNTMPIYTRLHPGLFLWLVKYGAT